MAEGRRSLRIPYTIALCSLWAVLIVLALRYVFLSLDTPIMDRIIDWASVFVPVALSTIPFFLPAVPNEGDPRGRRRAHMRRRLIFVVVGLLFSCLVWYQQDRAREKAGGAQNAAVKRIIDKSQQDLDDLRKRLKEAENRLSDKISSSQSSLTQSIGAVRTPAPRAHIHFRNAQLLPIGSDNKITINLDFQNDEKDDAHYSRNTVMTTSANLASYEERISFEDRIFNVLVQQPRRTELKTIPGGQSVRSEYMPPADDPGWIAKYKAGENRLYYAGRFRYHDKTSWYHSDFCYFWEINETAPHLCNGHNEEPRTADEPFHAPPN